MPTIYRTAFINIKTGEATCSDPEESDAIWIRFTMYLAEIIKKDPERFKDCFEKARN